VVLPLLVVVLVVAAVGGGGRGVIWPLKQVRAILFNFNQNHLWWFVPSGVKELTRGVSVVALSLVSNPLNFNN
jgi:hypothetical protein